MDSGPQLFVTLFGSLRLEVDGVPFALSSRRRTLPLLAYLLLHRRENLARDYVAFVLWPDETEGDALTKLRSNIHELTKALPPADVPWLLVSASNLRWNPAAPVAFDVERFEQAAADAERCDEAAALYTDDLLAGLEEAWVVGERERLRRLLLAALERGVARADRAGETERALDYARRMLALDPFREDVLRRRMTLLASSGRQTDALAEYRAFEAAVRRELAAEPMPESRALRDRIAAGTDGAASDAHGDAPLSPRRTADLGPLVGREHELAWLEGRWSRTRTRCGGLVFIGGEAGIGKSRLIAQFANDLTQTGGRVMAGGTSAPESGPYQAVLEALRSALPLVSALRFEPLWKQTLATLVPELGANEPAALPALAPSAQAERVHEAVARALIALATARPLLVVFEDLHWASAATLDAVRALARRIAREPILIAVTYRDDELERSHPLATLMREVASEALAETLPLRALGLDDVARMAQRADLTAARIAEIHRATAGNAFFVTQLLASDARDDAVPGGVAAAVAARLERLPSTAREVAHLAALAGTNFSREVLFEAAGRNAAEVGDALDTLIERRFVRERPGRGPFALGFTHELVRQTIVDLAPATPEQHGRFARMIETCHPELADELALELAARYERAGDVRQAAQRFARAARRALEFGAVASAEDALARGLALPLDARTRTELLLIGLQAGHRGDVALLDERIERLEALAAELDDEELRATALTSRAERLLLVGDHLRVDETAALLRERARAFGEPRWRAMADQLDAQITTEAGDHERAFLTAERALEAFRALGDAKWASRSLYVLARIAVRRGEAATARRLCGELEAGAANGAYADVLRAAVLQYLAEAEFGAPDDAVARAARWIEIAAHAGDRREESRARDMHAHALLLAGRGGLAAETGGIAVALASETGLDRGSRPALLHFATVALKLGAFQRSIELLEELRALRSGVMDPESYHMLFLLSTLGLARAYRGDRAEARALGVTTLAICERLRLPARRAVALKYLAETARHAGDHAAAFAYAAESLDLRERHGLAAKTKSALPAALAAARLGRIDEARARLVRIGDDERAVFHGEYWRERTALHLAQAWHACGDAARASRWLATAERERDATLAGAADVWRSPYLEAWWSREIAQARAGRWPEPSP